MYITHIYTYIYLFALLGRSCAAVLHPPQRHFEEAKYVFENIFPLIKRKNLQDVHP